MKSNKSVRYIWLRSYIMLLIVIIAVFLIFFIWSHNLIENEAINMGYNSSVFMRDVIDNRLDEVRELSNQIIYNQENISLSNSDNPRDFITVESYELTNYIKNFLIANSFIKGIYVYYPQCDYVVGNLGNYPSKAYFLLMNGLSDSGYHEWMNDMTDMTDQSFYMKTGGNGTTLFFKTYVPIGDQSHPPVMIAQINIDEVTNVLTWSNTHYPKSTVAMLDRNNEIYTYVGEKSSIESVKDKIDLQSDKHYLIADNKILIVQSSNVGQFKYLMVHKKSDLLKVVYSSTEVFIITFICCFIIGLGLSFYFSTTNSNPLTELVKHLRSGPEDDSKNEYEILEKRIDCILNQSRTAMQQIEQQQSLLNQSFVSMILRENYKSDQAIFALCRAYNINFEFPYFQSIAIKILNRQNDCSVSWTELINSFNSLETSILYSDIDGIISFILNSENNNNEDTDEFVKRAVEFASKENLEIKIGVGRVCDKMSNIYTSYNEALSALESDEDIDYYSDSDKKVVSVLEYGEMMVEFQKYLLEKKYEEAIAVLPELISNYLALDDSYIVNCRKNAIINQVLEAYYQEFRNSGRSHSDSEMESLNSLFKNSAPAVLKEDIISALRNLERLSDSENSNSISIACKAKDIIDSNFSDPMLGLYSIADKIGVSNSYLSKIFKAQYGIGVAKYINQVRINKAKELIIKGEMTVKDVAESVGFSSQVNFIRVFKQFEHTTPGKFKIC